MKAIKTGTYYLPIIICALGLLLLPSSTSAQNLFEADFGSGNIYEFSPEGAQSNFVSGVSGSLAFDSSGNLYAGNPDAGTITKVTPAGVQSIFASGLDPFGLAFNSAGNLFVANHGSGIIEIAPDGTQSTYVSGLANAPYDIAIDSTGDLFVGTQLGPRIYEITTNKTVSVFESSEHASSLAFDSEGDLFIGDGPYIYEFINNSGTLSSTPILFASGLGYNVTALAFDNSGDLFEAATLNGTAGNLNEFINNNGVLSATPTPFASGLNWPYALAFQPVPEPSALALLAVGSIALFVRRR